MKGKDKKLRIAVIDDEKVLLGVFSSLMDQFGYTADFFDNPTAAFETIAANPELYRLVVADVHMDHMDGITFAKKVRIVLPDVPFIFMSGNMTPEIRQQIDALGNTMALEKPFPLISTLKDKIAQLLV